MSFSSHIDIHMAKRSIEDKDRQAKIARLVGSRHCSVAQAAQTFASLSGLDALEDEEAYKQACQSVENAAAHICNKYKKT